MKLPEVKRLVTELRLPAGDFALHGSGPLLAYGLVDEINDVDIVSRGAAWRHALTLAAAEQARLDDVVRPLPGVEIFNGWLGDDADELVDSSSLVAGLPCVTLDAVLAFKRRLARPKDEEHIRLIESYLRNHS
ncbi:MAG: hypothetical protein WD314_07520 [Trueperaceae bacterium]